jgi:uncharacterized protein
MRGRAMRGLVAVLVASALALVAARDARAYNVPPIQGHVTDTAEKLTTEDRDVINQRLEALRLRTGYEIAVLVTGSLEGETIYDVANKT